VAEALPREPRWFASIARNWSARLRWTGLSPRLENFERASKNLPPVVSAIPVFIIVGRLGLMDTYPALVIPYAAFNLPIIIWMLRSFVQQIPQEIEEAALIVEDVEGAELDEGGGAVLQHVDEHGRGRAALEPRRDDPGVTFDSARRARQIQAEEVLAHPQAAATEQVLHLSLIQI